MEEEKAYEPTPSRVERAKREGDVARSQELSGVAAFACALGGAALAAAPIGSAAKSVLVAGAAGTSNNGALLACLGWMLVPVACAGAAAVACGAAQSGGLRVMAITLKPERLSPAENLKRIFSREAVMTAARASVAFLCAAFAIVPAFAAILAASVRAGQTSVAAAAWQGALRSAGIACAVGAVFASMDYGVQFVRWRKRLRMSFEELKRDRKEHDGDPLLRSRRRALHRQLSRGSLRRVRDAAFVVTNPTHIAIALEYRPPDVPVPRVLVRAADETAARVRELAAAHSIPLVENVALARALFATAQPGDFVPQETYVAVAEVVAALQRSER